MNETDGADPEQKNLNEKKYLQGRIVKGIGGLYTVDTAAGRFACNVRGIFRKKNFTPLVGDYVFLDEIDYTKFTATISKFEERKTELIRPRVANVDQAIIVFAAESPTINFDLLERLIILTEEQKLDVVICINKVDLVDNYLVIEEFYEEIGYKVVSLSATNKFGIEKLREILSGKVSVFAGPSGVGKSSIVNNFLEFGKMETGELSTKIERGKHTTRHAELIEIFEDTYIVDSPGFTSLSLSHIMPQTLDRLFREFQPHLGRCRFSDCRHINEPDCAIKEQVGINISVERYERYVSIYEDLYNSRT